MVVKAITAPPGDDGAAILRPAAFAQLEAIEAEHGCEIERRLDVKRLDER
jgi:hypothetical protein